MMIRMRKCAISLILVVSILVQFVVIFTAHAETYEKPTPYKYTIPSEIISKENIEFYGHKERLYTLEKSLNEIHLLNEDGTVSAYMFDYPVKYIGRI